MKEPESHVVHVQVNVCVSMRVCACVCEFIEQMNLHAYLLLLLLLCVLFSFSWCIDDTQPCIHINKTTKHECFLKQVHKKYVKSVQSKKEEEKLKRKNGQKATMQNISVCFIEYILTRWQNCGFLLFLMVMWIFLSLFRCLASSYWWMISRSLAVSWTKSFS